MVLARNTHYLKGHGTKNDFVLLPDPEGDLDLAPSIIRALCDRRSGVGGDGVLRVVRAARVPEVVDTPDADWFMDYRNADGSVAEMCGNGLRVFSRYLTDYGLVHSKEFSVATRDGAKHVHVHDNGDVTVNMGKPEVLDEHPTVFGLTGIAVSTGNPHVVVSLGSDSQAIQKLSALDLTRPPEVRPSLPNGQNVAVVVRDGPRSLRMRIHERGVGETFSCGTNVTAAVVATIFGSGDGRGERWTVAVPGGQLGVEWAAAGSAFLTGPAIFVAEGWLSQQWWEEQSTT